MVPVLIAGLIAMVAAVVIGPKFIELLRCWNLGQQIRAEGPATHAVKQGTPTMGGLLILASAVVPFLFLSQYTAEGMTVLFMVLGCALIGFTDDYLKVHRRRSLGLPGRWKMIGLVAVTVGAALLLNESTSFTTDVYVPVVGWTLDLSFGYYVLLFLVIGGTVNGANLTDGVDGLGSRNRGDHAADVPRGRRHRVDPLGRPWRQERHVSRHRHPGRGADRRDDRIPLVQRLPRRGAHGRHRLVRTRRSHCRLCGRDRHRDPAPADRRHLRHRGDVVDHPGGELQVGPASACS